MALCKCLACSYKLAFPIPGHSSCAQFWMALQQLAEKCYLLLALAYIVLQNKSTVNNCMNSRVIILKWFLTAHISCKNIYSSSHLQMHWVPSWVLPFSRLTSPPVCKLCGPNWLSYTCILKFWWSLENPQNSADDCCLANTRKNRIHVLIGS